MLVLAINGSPRRTGSTARMLLATREVVEAAGARFTFCQVSEVLAELKVPYCTVCSDPCTGKCFSGTRLEEIFNLMRRADGIIMGSPVYFSTVSSHLKAFWDRTRLLRREKALINVVGGALTVGGSRFGGQETALRTMHDMMLCQGMTVVGDGYLEYDAGHQGACAQDPASEDILGLQRAKILARRVVEVALATRDLRKRSRAAGG
ncbi:flavodoxin family protein [Desulfofundulus thermocisternus]|uniref:flavodoxin family protein n=1 Tax=Desulfofundulus thermocisternus TaxID=42471 RepID=UPI0019E59486|nr:flavodoxin family protein [Desulfofundulus thermocisternus]MBE3585566.1 flavodoxin family protein [Thermoanaerobacter sp.]MCS5696163.1 flavodoxin family protein [Desulfofundulus thermocisternus]